MPSPAAMTGPPNGAPTSAPPAVEDEGAVDDEAVDAAAGLVGAVDVFVFHRAAADRFALLGGVGRGHGWAGTVEYQLTEPTALRPAADDGRPARWQAARPAHIFGPYWATSAILVRLDDDVLVLFGDLHDVTAVVDGPLMAAAARAAAAVTAVPAAKRVADELTALHAVRRLAQVRADTVAQTMTAIARIAAETLSCEVGLVSLDDGRYAYHERGDVLSRSGGDLSATLAAWWACVSGDAPPGAAGGAVCCQDARRAPIPGLDSAVCSYYLLPIGQPASRLLALIHTGRAPRGFTMRCRGLGVQLAAVATTLVGTARLRENLHDELRQVVRVVRIARTDAITGYGPRLAWDDAAGQTDGIIAAGGLLGVVTVAVTDPTVNRSHGTTGTTGHTVGGRLIDRLATVLAAQVRAGDLLTRIGRDEVAVLLPGADQVAARRVAARIRAAITDSNALAAAPHTAVVVGAAYCPVGGPSAPPSAPPSRP